MTPSGNDQNPSVNKRNEKLIKIINPEISKQFNHIFSNKLIHLNFIYLLNYMLC